MAASKAQTDETTTTDEQELALENDSQESDELALSGSNDIVATGDEEDVNSEDSLTFSNGVIEKIVAIAMKDVPGVVGMKGGWLNRVQDTFGMRDPRKGVNVEVTPESSVRVNIAILIEYGVYAPKVFEDVKRAVVKQVTGMTGLDIAGVNLRIEDVLTPEDLEARQRRNRLNAPELEAASEDNDD